MSCDTIVQIELIEVFVPSRHGSINSPGIHKPLHMLPYEDKQPWQLQFDELPKWILIMTCEDGAVGFGETYRGAGPEKLQSMAGVLIGKRISELNWGSLPLPACREYDGFECAVYDLAGKTAGVPVCSLLGGRVRDRVLVSAWSGHRTAEDAAEVAANALAADIHHIKFKCSAEENVFGWAEAIHARCGDGMKIIFDPNGRFHDIETAVKIAMDLELVGNVLCIEDPLPRSNLEGYAEVRRSTSIPIAVHVALGYTDLGQRREDIVKAKVLHAADMYNLSAGIAEFMRLSAAADLFGMHYWHGSEVDLGILEAAYVHEAAASPGCTLPSDIFGRRIREHDLLREPLKLEGEWVTVPSGPGLGVELDQEALARYGRKRIMINRKTAGE